MTDKELKKLSRVQLLELLLAQSRALEETQAQLQEAREALDSRRLQVEETGNLAEAALRLNQVFDAAQNAADQYLLNVKSRNQVMDEALRQAEQIVTAAQTRASRLEAETREKCDAMTQKAQQDSQRYWDNLRKKLDRYMEQHPELKKELLEKQRRL